MKMRHRKTRRDDSWQSFTMAWKNLSIWTDRFGIWTDKVRYELTDLAYELIDSEYELIFFFGECKIWESMAGRSCQLKVFNKNMLFYNFIVMERTCGIILQYTRKKQKQWHVFQNVRLMVENSLNGITDYTLVWNMNIC